MTPRPEGPLGLTALGRSGTGWDTGNEDFHPGRANRDVSRAAGYLFGAGVGVCRSMVTKVWSRRRLGGHRIVVPVVLLFGIPGLFKAPTLF